MLYCSYYPNVKKSEAELAALGVDLARVGESADGGEAMKLPEAFIRQMQGELGRASARFLFYL